MKSSDIDNSGNVKVQASVVALGSLGLSPFNGKQFLTARGSLVNPLGGGWYWVCPFGGNKAKAAEGVLADLLDVEEFERKAAPVKRQA